MVSTPSSGFHASPTLAQRLARPAAIALSPLLIAQGRKVRGLHPKMPPAPQPWNGVIEGPEPLHVLGVGDSTIAGVGVEDAALGLVPQFSRALHEFCGRGVSWRSIGESGATSKEILRRFLAHATGEPADVVLVSLGANDAKDLKPLRATIARFERLTDALHTAHPNATLLFSSLPAFNQFPTLPQPLRAVLYAHSQAIERSLRGLIEARAFAFMSPPPPKYSEGFFAPDGFHPSVSGYRDWANFAFVDALERGALEHLTPR
jgi:lysophospholipase L1-like esterase